MAENAARMIVLLEFLFEDDISLDTKVAVIKDLQEFFGKVCTHQSEKVKQNRFKKHFGN